MREALWWSRLPIGSDTVCAELGCAPGGSAQALLERGAIVLGVDPAEVDPSVLKHPNFIHLRGRVRQIRRRDFFPARYIVADMNVAPEYTLDAVEELVAHERIHIHGLLLTIKLPDWTAADRIADYVARVRSWGFREVRVRQLQHNRQEICLAALRRRALRKKPPAPKRRAASSVDRSLELPADPPSEPSANPSTDK
jgi:23S rRNA (cytidine2498-2'-O)-methyltransferase